MSKGMQWVKRLAMSALLVAVVAITPSATVAAADLDPCTLDPGSILCQDKAKDIDSVFKTIVNTLLFVVGAVSVIVLIIAGIRYTTSGGNSNSVAAAKNTMLYAIIGLVVSIFAYAIVYWIAKAANNAT